MDFHLYATFFIIAAAIVAFALERWAIEGVSIATLTALLLVFGVYPYQGADGTIVSVETMLSGFANPALATVISLLIVGQGLFATDAMEHPARVIGKLGGASAWRPIILVLIVTGTVSAFLNNTPVVVIFMPILAVIAAQRGIKPGRVFMPLSFITILGGMTTLIGSSTNLIAAGVAARLGHPVGFFDLTGMGVLLAIAGAVYVLAVLPRILPERESSATSETRSGAQFIGEITLGPGHPFVGIASKGGMFPGLGDLTLRMLEKREEPFLPPFDEMVLEPGDTLVVSGTRKAFMRALAQGRAGPEPAEDAEDVDIAPQGGPHYHLAEAVIAPGSRYAGRTIQLSGLSVRLGVSVLGVQRKSRMARTALSEIRLEPGDTLLIGGPLDNIKALRGDHDLLLLEHSAEAVPQSRKAPVAGAIFLAIVVASALSLVPIAVAAIAGVAAMLATGCLSLHQAARAFDRQIFLLIGVSVAMATAMEATGGAALIANGAVGMMAGAPVYVALSALFLLIAVMTNILSNNATAVLFMPIALGIADGFGAPAAPFIAAVIFGANCSFATPIGYQTNLLVMGPGHYRFIDFIKGGTPLVVIVWVVFSLLAPWYYGL